MENVKGKRHKFDQILVGPNKQQTKGFKRDFNDKQDAAVASAR